MDAEVLGWFIVDERAVVGDEKMDITANAIVVKGDLIKNMAPAGGPQMWRIQEMVIWLLTAEGL
ncbi:hypothetical protein BDB00DRAFT_823770 [Zychaea mexicana]|uniref:uncharacterized protein n=1 Tax=Zychaea mexicana TaxID=64656 RepID=UPI0022FE0FBF|nr:uncharacterized protein BDB00DRAFT_823770 [Zychaea mexicana]KAI9493370.1 hypothetical protein BDB00DRAFT_823770 [Zychaea mexicana]